MTDTTDLAARLRSYAREQGGWCVMDETCEEAADTIERLTRERDEARAGLRVLLSYTEQLELMVYSSEQNETVHPTVQAARAALKEPT